MTKDAAKRKIKDQLSKLKTQKYAILKTEHKKRPPSPKSLMITGFSAGGVTRPVVDTQPVQPWWHARQARALVAATNRAAAIATAPRAPLADEGRRWPCSSAHTAMIVERTMLMMMLMMKMARRTRKMGPV